MEKIRDNIYVETTYLCNSSLVLTSEGIVLIDPPGLKVSEALEWKNQVEKYGKVAYIVNTDHHWDHTVGNYFFSGDIIVHEGTMTRLLAEGRMEYSKKLMTLIEPQSGLLSRDYRIKRPTFTYRDKMTIYLGEEVFELIHISGHSEDETIVYMPEKKVLFSGDNVCTNGIPNLGESSPLEWLEVLKSMEEMDIEVLVPGHGNIGNKNSIKQFREELQSLLTRVKEKIEKGSNREDIVREVSYRDDIHLKFPAEMSERFDQIRRNGIGKVYDVLAQKNPAGRIED